MFTALKPRKPVTAIVDPRLRTVSARALILHPRERPFSTTPALVPSQPAAGNPEQSSMSEQMSTTAAGQSEGAAVEAPPPITHILETALQVKDIHKATAFYRDVFHIQPFLSNDRMSAFALGSTTLLLFSLGKTLSDTHLPPPPTPAPAASSGTIPGHGPTPPLLDLLIPDGKPAPRDTALQEHFCFAVPSAEDTREWEAWLKAKGVLLRGVMDWERGGRSVYFEDVDGNVGEVASRGIWPHY